MATAKLNRPLSPPRRPSVLSASRPIPREEPSPAAETAPDDLARPGPRRTSSGTLSKVESLDPILEAEARVREAEELLEACRNDLSDQVERWLVMYGDAVEVLDKHTNETYKVPKHTIALPVEGGVVQLFMRRTRDKLGHVKMMGGLRRIAVET